MTNPRPRTTDEPEQTDDKPKGVQLSPAQVTAGALASVSAAVVASFFGLAGTLIGAALASVISTVSAVLYQESLERTNAKLRRVREQDTTTQVLGDGTREMSVVPAVPVTRELPERLDPRQTESPRSRPRWVKLAVYATGIFVIAMGVITGIELIGQKPVSALVGNTETSRSTTLGAITNTSPSTEEQQQEESEPLEEDPASPTATTPATESSSPTTAPEDDEESETEEITPATPTQSSAADPTANTGTRTDEEPASPTTVPQSTPEQSSQDE